MLSNLFKEIVTVLKENNFILKREADVYKHDSLVLITNILTTVGIFIIGYYINIIELSVVLSVVLVIFRTFAGGTLENSYFKYCIYSVSKYLIIIGLAVFIPTEVKDKLSSVCLLISALIICKSTLGKNKETLLTKGKRERKRLVRRIILIGILELSIILNWYTDIVFFISCILLNISINTVLENSNIRKIKTQEIYR